MIFGSMTSGNDRSSNSYRLGLWRTRFHQRRRHDPAIPFVGLVRIATSEARRLRARIQAAAERHRRAGPFGVPAGSLDALVAVWLVLPPLPHLGEAHAVQLVLPPCPVSAEPLSAGLPAGGGLGSPGADGCRDAADGCNPGEGVAHAPQHAVLRRLPGPGATS